MNRNLLKFFVVFLIFTVFTGCIATHVGNMTGSASLDAPNFMYKKHNIHGEAKATYVLGIGGEARQSLVLEAKKNMLKENPLLQNQALANVSVSFKSTRFVGLIVATVKCHVSADIVEFGAKQSDFSLSQNPTTALPDNTSPTGYVKTENSNTETNTSTNTIIMVGDKVNIINYFNYPIEGKVIEINNGNYTVEYSRSNNKIKKVKVLPFQVQKIK